MLPIRTKAQAKAAMARNKDPKARRQGLGKPNVARPAGAVAVLTNPAITGTPTVGTPLNITAGSFSGTPTPTVTRAIFAGGDPVAVASGYTPVAADIGKIFTVVETGSNTVAGTAYSASAMSANSAACLPASSLPAAPTDLTLVPQAGSLQINFTPSTSPDVIEHEFVAANGVKTPIYASGQIIPAVQGSATTGSLRARNASGYSPATANATATATTGQYKPFTFDSRIGGMGDSIMKQDLSPSAFITFQMGVNANFFMPNGYNMATAGDNTRMTLTKLPTMQAMKLDALFIAIGTNNITLMGDSAAYILADIATIRDAAIASGVKIVFLQTVLPRNDASYTSIAAYATVRAAVNDGIRAMARPDTVIMDMETDFDPATMTLDGLHPNWAGAIVLGRTSSNGWTGKVTPYLTQTDPSSLYLDASNLLLAAGNPQFVGTAGNKTAGTPTPTGDFADSWTAQITGTGSVLTGAKVANAQGSAIGQEIIVSGTADAASRLIVFAKSSPTAVVIDDVFDGLVYVDVKANQANVRPAMMTVGISGFTPGRTTSVVPPAMSGWIRASSYRSASNTSSVNCQLGCQSNGTSAMVADMVFAKPYVRRVTGYNATNP